MNNFTHGLAKRVLSLAMTLLMILSLCAVGITSTSAAEVEVAQTAANVTFAAGDYIYIKNFTPSGWSANWFASDVYEWAHIWNSSTSSAIDIQFSLVEGTENAVGAIYGAKITTAGTYTHVIFSRSHSSTTPWDNQNQTGDIPLHATFNCYTNLTVGGTSYSGSNYTPASTVNGDFWADLDGDVATTIDAIYPDEGTLYLPSSADRTAVTMFTSEGTLTINGTNVTTAGATVNLSANSYTLGGDFSGTLKVMKSANVSSIHTTTNIDVPQGTYQGYEHKDDFETKGEIIVLDPDGTQKNENTTLKKIKGRGNSSWEASHKIIGKYAFNITLDKKAKLLDDSSKSKKYCLVSYNADEARMRNMLIYDLASEIGVDYVAKFEPVDLYNNGKYIGSYLLTDKVEIGDPLVDIVNLDEVNELLGTEDEDVGPFGTNFGLYDDDSLMTRASSNGNINDTSTKGFYKYISNLEEPDPSEYADSGFLLEFELNSRFQDEISGFISNKGQQIVCKYPEFATKNEITFIMNKWNTAEALMYNKSATYEQLDAVIDVESFARMYLIQELSKNLDGGATSFYVFYHEGKLHAGCAWDYDWTLGQYANIYTDRVNSNSDFNNQVDADPSTYGGWYMNSKNIYIHGNSLGSSGTLNAQAALCQNDAYWGVVTAEWNELFYDTALGYTANSGSITSTSQLGGKIAEYYNLVKASTAMDEDKWGLIASDPFITNYWGSADTGDTHDDATVALSNWVYNRLTWMNKYIGTDGANHGTAPYNVDYVIQPPVITADADSYAVGDTVTLTIENVTGGTYTYDIYKDGTKVGTSTDGTYTFTADKRGTANYTAVAKSATSGKVSAASDAAAVNVEGFTFALDVTAPESVYWNEEFKIVGSSNAGVDYRVTYSLYYFDELVTGASDAGDGSFVLTMDSTKIGEASEFTVVAEVTIDGETFTDSKTVTVNVNDYDFTTTLNLPQTVEAGLSYTVSANAKLDGQTTVTYEFYNASNNSLLATNASGNYIVSTTQSDLNSSASYYVVAKATATDKNGVTKSYESKSETKTITVIPVQATYTVTIYFKSTSTYGYEPEITTTGAVTDFSNHYMTRDLYICKNASQTASYYWYKTDVTVSKAAPSLYIRILSDRYDMEVRGTFEITETCTLWLGVDDLNTGKTLVDMTSWTETERNWTKNGSHMIYDAEYDAESLSSTSAIVNLRFVGDTNGDGIVNVKDATFIQKSIAGLVQIDPLSREISDVDCDGVVTIKDATALQKRVALL
ncbi:MAG: CotH kinase family protein [Ruminococcus sp.]|nr:CotH kinase family protein [Ruminococcus sp.]